MNGVKGCSIGLRQVRFFANYMPLDGDGHSSNLPTCFSPHDRAPHHN